MSKLNRADGMAKALASLGWALVKVAGGKVPKEQTSFNFDAPVPAAPKPAGPEPLKWEEKQSHHGGRHGAVVNLHSATTPHGEYNVFPEMTRNGMKYALTYFRSGKPVERVADKLQSRGAAKAFADQHHAKQSRRQAADLDRAVFSS